MVESGGMKRQREREKCMRGAEGKEEREKKRELVKRNGKERRYEGG